MKSKSNLIIILIASIIIFGGLISLAAIVKKKQPRTDYSEFIACMAEKEVKFYGASWCPHCRNQKAIFQGQSEVLTEKGVYIECSINGGQEQTQVCIDAKIQSYPTWEINGERIPGELTLETLSEKSSCPLPQEVE